MLVGSDINNSDCLALKNIRVGFDATDGTGGELAFQGESVLLVVNPSVANCPGAPNEIDIPIVF